MKDRPVIAMPFSPAYHLSFSLMVGDGERRYSWAIEIMIQGLHLNFAQLFRVSSAIFGQTLAYP